MKITAVLRFCLCGLMMIASPVFALGLAGLSVHSALNQPLVADIEVISLAGVERDKITFRIASNEMFAQAGLPKPSYLNKIEFSWGPPLDDNVLLRLTTREPVKDPYLNFLIEVRWPDGQLVREYTILLDPPVLAATRHQARPNLGSAKSKTSVSQSASTHGTAVQPTPSGKTYKTTTGQTLWQIARLTRSDRTLSLPDQVALLHALNPNAFMNGNVNRLRAGAVLKLPQQPGQAKQQQSPQLGSSQATVSHQVSPAATSPGAGRLQLVVASQKEAMTSVESRADASASTSTSTDPVSTLQQELRLSQEALETTKRQNEVLTAEVKQLNQRLQELRRQISEGHKATSFSEQKSLPRVPADQAPTPERQRSLPPSSQSAAEGDSLFAELLNQRLNLLALVLSGFIALLVIGFSLYKALLRNREASLLNRFDADIEQDPLFQRDSLPEENDVFEPNYPSSQDPALINKTVAQQEPPPLTVTMVSEQVKTLWQNDRWTDAEKLLRAALIVQPERRELLEKLFTTLRELDRLDSYDELLLSCSVSFRTQKRELWIELLSLREQKWPGKALPNELVSGEVADKPQLQVV